MASFNKVLMIGNLTKDPEVRYTPQGTAVASLRLASNRKFRSKNSQEWKEEVCFVTVVVWDKQAETCNQYLHKGSQIFVEGKLQSRSWEDKTGAKRSVIEVRADRVQFLGSPQARAAGPVNTPEEPGPPAAAEASSETEWLEEETDKVDSV